MPKFSRSADFPFGLDEEGIRKSAKYYTQGRLFKAAAPSWADDPLIGAQAARYERLSCSPGNYRALCEMNIQLDARHILGQIRVPTLVLHQTGDPLAPIEGARYFAENVPCAKLIEHPGINHWFSADDYPAIVADIEEFVTGAREIAVPEDQVLATVLFTDIVDSTAHAARLGDEAWRRLLDEHDQVLRRLVAQHRGRVVKTTGDGRSRCSTGRGARSVVRLRSSRRWRACASACARGCIRAKSLCAATMTSPGLRSTPRRE